MTALAWSAALTMSGAPVIPATAAAGIDWEQTQAAQCSAAIAAAEKQYDIPDKLLFSIAKVESGKPISSERDIQPWPWTINADGASYYFPSKAAAIAWEQSGLQRGIHFTDLGCLQVNWQYHHDAFDSIDEAFDPMANASYAGHYLRTLYAEAGNNWSVAVGLYHSHSPDLAAGYRDRVAAINAAVKRRGLFEMLLSHGLYAALLLALACSGALTLSWLLLLRKR